MKGKEMREKGEEGKEGEEIMWGIPLLCLERIKGREGIGR